MKKIMGLMLMVVIFVMTMVGCDTQANRVSYNLVSKI